MQFLQLILQQKVQLRDQTIREIKNDMKEPQRHEKLNESTKLQTGRKFRQYANILDTIQGPVINYCYQSLNNFVVIAPMVMNWHRYEA